jgi:hypothetical protein
MLPALWGTHVEMDFNFAAYRNIWQAAIQC